jgi:hypothetical protein
MSRACELTDSEKVQRICALLTDNQVTQSLDPEQLAELKATLVTELSEEDYYLILSSKSARRARRTCTARWNLSGSRTGPSTKRRFAARGAFTGKGPIVASAPGQSS